MSQKDVWLNYNQFNKLDWTIVSEILSNKCKSGVTHCEISAHPIVAPVLRCHLQIFESFLIKNLIYYSIIEDSDKPLASVSIVCFGVQ